MGARNMEQQPQIQGANQVTDTDTQPQIDVWKELMRPFLTKRAALIYAVGLPLLAASNLVLSWSTGHFSASEAVFWSLIGLLGPVVVLGRYLVTGRLDALPRQPQSDQLG